MLSDLKFYKYGSHIASVVKVSPLKHEYQTMYSAAHPSF